MALNMASLCSAGTNGRSTPDEASHSKVPLSSFTANTRNAVEERALLQSPQLAWLAASSSRSTGAGGGGAVTGDVAAAGGEIVAVKDKPSGSLAGKPSGV
jgi:hypothetical protein